MVDARSWCEFARNETKNHWRSWASGICYLGESSNRTGEGTGKVGVVRLEEAGFRSHPTKTLYKDGGEADREIACCRGWIPESDWAIPNRNWWTGLSREWKEPEVR